jgi:sulfatase maturation enzyme AslB (radical SAM superfamily)
MSNLQRRIEQAEEALSMGQEPIIVNVVWFGGEPVPPGRATR